MRHLDQLSAAPLLGIEDARNPFFSPDGRWIAFFDSSHSKLKKVSVAGGLPVTLCDVRAPRGGSWIDNDSIVLQSGTFQRNALLRVAAAGGSPEPFFKAPEIDASIGWPQVCRAARPSCTRRAWPVNSRLGMCLCRPLPGRTARRCAQRLLRSLRRDGPHPLCVAWIRVCRAIRRRSAGGDWPAVQVVEGSAQVRAQVAPTSGFRARVC